jgi:uncharacterized protein (DUF305 family)
VRSLSARYVVVLVALVTMPYLSSCSKPAADGRVHPTSTEIPVVTGEPAGNNAEDIAFANNMISNDEQGIDMSSLARDRSHNPDAVTFAASNVSVLQSDTQVLKVLLLQWNESPNNNVGGGGHNGTAKGIVDPATIVKLRSLNGSQFDALWLQSVISLDEGAIDLSEGEIAKGKNVDAIRIAKLIEAARRDQIAHARQMLRG